MKRADLTGQRFGRLVVVEPAPSRAKKTFWACRCDCGKSHVVRTECLKQGSTQSCGCLYRVDRTDPTRLACQRFTKRYPDGRTGTLAGYLAHYYIGQTACPACMEGSRRERAAFRVENELEILRGNLWSRFRLTLERYEELLDAQEHRCAICGVGAPRDIRSNRFHVDHDHACCPGRTSCGRCVRGLLCHACNTALGNFADDRERLQRAIDYLDRRASK